MNNEKMPDIGTAVIIIMVTIAVIFAGVAYFYRRELAYLFFVLARYDAYLAYLVSKLTGGAILSKAGLLHSALWGAKYVKPDPLSFDVLVLVGNRWVPAVSMTFEYLKWFNLAALGVFFYLPSYYVLKKYSKRIHERSKPIKAKPTNNPPVPLYGKKFDPLLRPPKRPVGDGPEGKEFRKYDYFPPEPFFAEDEYEEYVSISIYYSTHPLNMDEERFSAMKRCWSRLLKEIAETDEKGEPQNVVGYYALMRFRFMDRMKTSILWDRKERKIFVGKWNENEKGVPITGLFTEGNSFEEIRKYMLKYRPDAGEDFTDVFLEELDAFLEILNFRYSKFGQKTAFFEGDIPSFGDFPLFLPEYGERKESPEYKANEKFVAKLLPELKKLLFVRPSRGRFMQPLLPRNYILHPLKRKGGFDPSDFDAPGIRLPVEIIYDNIVEGYLENQERAAAELEEEIKTMRSSGTVSMEEIKAKKALLAEIRSKMDVENERTRFAKIKEIFETHDFQETALISLWEYAMKLQNMPTGKLVSVKYENVALWYALCNLGGVFYYKPGMPISTMREMEREKAERTKKLEEKYDSEEIRSIRDVAGEEFVRESMEEYF